MNRSPDLDDKRTASTDGPRVLHTPDGRYIVVRGRLWRAANPQLPESERMRLVESLMAARRRLRGAPTPQARVEARAAVHAAKVGLGERGPVWWADGAADFNRCMARNTPYAEWFAARQAAGLA